MWKLNLSPRISMWSTLACYSLKSHCSCYYICELHFKNWIAKVLISTEKKKRRRNWSHVSSHQWVVYTQQFNKFPSINFLGIFMIRYHFTQSRLLLQRYPLALGTPVLQYYQRWWILKSHRQFFHLHICKFSVMIDEKANFRLRLISAHFYLEAIS